jgi:hypothetical protein
LAEFFSLFAGHLECIILNGGYSTAQATALSHQIPYVVTIPHELSESVARDFIRGFYEAIVAEKSHEHAFEYGCAAIRLLHGSEREMPVLTKRE